MTPPSTAQVPLTILHRDAHIVAVHKPPGLLVHRSAISRDSVFLLQRLRDQLGQRVYPVHRLDRATSGVIVFGLDPGTAAALADGFAAGTVVKGYLAVARGWVDAEGLIDHPVRDEDAGADARPASTRYRRLATLELPYAVDRYPSTRYSLVAVEPLTGRRQQIRKHFKHISHHLVGDTTHGNGRHNRFFRDRLGIDRLLLQAQSLTFTHPVGGALIAIEAVPDPAWRRIEALFGVSLFPPPART
jgi:tRNA pseudouridine65 synthase